MTTFTDINSVLASRNQASVAKLKQSIAPDSPAVNIDAMGNVTGQNNAVTRSAATATDPKRANANPTGPAPKNTTATKPQETQVQQVNTPPPAMTPKKEPVNLKYPLDLPDNFQMIFHFGEYTNKVALDNQYMNYDLSIALPLPGNLADSTSLGYSSPNMGAITGEFLPVLNRIAESSDMIKSANQEIQQALRNPGRLASDIGRIVARRVVSGLSPTLGAALDLSRGNTPNPHIAVAFNNVGLRTFTFSWKFSPNSKAESLALWSIIRKIQQRILPEKDGGNFLLKYPNHCQVLICPDMLDAMFLFKPCVVESFNVNYAPNGIPSVFEGTNLPTEMDVSISLKEVQIRTSGDYGDDKLDNGVPRSGDYNPNTKKFNTGI